MSVLTILTLANSIIDGAAAGVVYAFALNKALDAILVPSAPLVPSEPPSYMNTWVRPAEAEVDPNWLSTSLATSSTMMIDYSPVVLGLKVIVYITLCNYT